MEDEVTGQGSSITRICVGVTQDETGAPILLRDWELLQVLNSIGRSDRVNRPIERESLENLAQDFLTHAQSEIGELVDMMIQPKLRMEILLVPEAPADC
ncbi:hypothetical protein [Sphingomonas oryzagri]